MVTLRDVARLAKVHQATVSRALNPQTRASVNEKTARRVLEAAAALGYRPNQLARAVRTSCSLSVGVVVPDITNPLFPPIVRGIEDRLQTDGYTLLLANTDNDPARERLVFEALHTRHVDGIIAAAALGEAGLAGDIASGGLPVVLVNRSLPDRSLSAVVANDDAAVRLAVGHLIRLGHRGIAYVGHCENMNGGGGSTAFLQAVRAAAVDGNPPLMTTGGTSTEEDEGARACRLLLTREPGWTAIVAATDLMAVGCYTALRKHGLSIPADISVVGLNDIPFSERFDPPLTTVRVPRYEIGRAAAGLLLEHLHRDTAPRRLVISPSLVARKSTAPPRHSRLPGPTTISKAARPAEEFKPTTRQLTTIKRNGSSSVPPTSLREERIGRVPDTSGYRRGSSQARPRARDALRPGD